MPDQTASPASAPVIVIDLQTTMFSGVDEPPLHRADDLVQRTRKVIDWARRQGRKLAFIRHDGPPQDSLAPGKPGWPVWPALGQAPDEPTFAKEVGDAFSQPALVDWVAGQGAKEVILLGAQTDQCVAATVKGALERGLAVTVVADAHSTWPSGGESADQIIERHNALFRTSGARVVKTDALVNGKAPPMPVNAYSFVEMYSHALQTAAHLIGKGEEHAAKNGVSEKDMLGWRLIDDMRPLAFQLKVVCDFARQWPARVAGLPVAPDVGEDLDLAGFRRAIAEAKADLARLGPEQFEGRDEIPLTHTLGTTRTVTLPGGRWLTVFATTNLYFHLSTAYDILRANGVPIGKTDLFAGGL